MVGKAVAVAGPGRRRRIFSVEQKRRVVEETFELGTSVSIVARRHDLNANLVFTWRVQYGRGLLGAPAPKLLPVEIAHSVAPVKGDAPRLRARAARKARIEITLANGHRVAVLGAVDVDALRLVIDTLTR